MENSSNKRKFSPTVWHPAARWAFVLGLCAVAGVIVSYYWRVFYGLDARGVPPLQITGLCVVLAMAAGAVALLLWHCKDFAKRGACCILLCGALFAFANPPLQTPDETDHYLRTYAISMGRFDFDAKRSYPEDVNELMDAFPGAWVNAHTSAGLGTDPDTNAEQPYNTAGYALKQYGKDGRVESIWDSFTQDLNWEKRDSAADSVTEPISFLILPFLPGALGMALTRLFGFGALGCLYGGRLMNLLVYTLLCYAALRSAKKCRPAFLAVMLLPMSLYMGASLSYDAALLACYYLMLALLTCPEWDGRTAAVYTAACVFANGTKPYINLLWVVLPLVVVRRGEWKARLNRAWYTVGTLAGALLLTQIVEQYGTLLRHNYGTIARQGGSTVNGGAQLLFVLKNPLRYIAVLLGTLYENDGFLGQLGLFGWKDMPVAFLNLTGPMVLLAAALLCAPKTNALGRRVRRRLRCGCHDRHVHHLHAGGHGAHRGPADAVLPARLAAAGCGRGGADPPRVKTGPDHRKGRGPGPAAVRLVRLCGGGAALPALLYWTCLRHLSITTGGDLYCADLGLGAVPAGSAGGCRCGSGRPFGL